MKTLKRRFSKKRCPKGEIRDPDTDKCISIISSRAKEILSQYSSPSSKKRTKRRSIKRMASKKTPQKRCPPGQIRNPATGRCVSKDGPTGKKLLKGKGTKVQRTKKSSSSKSSKDSWPRSLPASSLEIYNTKGYKPSREDIRKMAVKLCKKYPDADNMHLINKLTKKIEDDKKGWTDKELKNYLLDIFWDRKVGDKKLVLKNPDWYDLNVEVLKRIFRENIKNIDTATNDVYEVFEDSVVGYPIHKNPFYSSGSDEEKEYNGLKIKIKDTIRQHLFDLESYKYKTNRKKLLGALEKFQ